MTYDSNGARYVVPGYGTIDIRPEGGKPVLTAPQPIPDWIIGCGKQGLGHHRARAASTIRAPRWKPSNTRPGWELWFFTLDSPFYGKGIGTLAGLALWGDRIDPAQSNAGYIASEFWTNKMWRHGDVVWAIFETILMAFLGTMTAAILALPLGLSSPRAISCRWVRCALPRAGCLTLSAGWTA